jgi:hypothetical protein
MLDARDILRIIAIVLISAGLTCIPVGWPPPNPKTWTSVFSLMSETGEFFVIGLVLTLLGFLLLGLTCIPRTAAFKRWRKDSRK